VVKPLYCALALLICAGRAPVLAAVAPPAFETACSTAKGRGTAVTSYRQFFGWADRYVSRLGAEPFTTTSVVDAVRLTFATSLYYRSRERANDKGYTQALYDPQHRLLAFCWHPDAWEEFALVADVPPPPFPVVHADLARVVTKHGIHLGSSVAQVEAVYGRSRLVRIKGRPPELSYLREIPMPDPNGLYSSPEGVETWFAIVNGRVASMSLGIGF
jgi:hypothetical protein